MKEELSDTLKEAMRLAREDELKEKYQTYEPEPVIRTSEVKFFCNAEQFNALLALLTKESKMYEKMEKTARTSFRSERSVKNTKRADKYRKLSELYSSIHTQIVNDNYDRF